MNKKQPENTERTKKKIREAFWELYKSERIEKITVKDISIKAACNRSTFYAYYKDVYDVLEQIEESVIPVFLEIPPLKVNRMDFKEFVNKFLGIYEEHHEIYSILLSEKGDPAFEGKIKQSIKPAASQMIQKEVKIEEIELDYILEFVLSATIGVLKYWYLNQENMPAEKLVSLLYQLMNNEIIRKIS